MIKLNWWNKIKALFAKIAYVETNVSNLSSNVTALSGTVADKWEYPKKYFGNHVITDSDIKKDIDDGKPILFNGFDVDFIRGGTILFYPINIPRDAGTTVPYYGIYSNEIFFIIITKGETYSCSIAANYKLNNFINLPASEATIDGTLITDSYTQNRIAYHLPIRISGELFYFSTATGTSTFIYYGIIKDKITVLSIVHGGSWILSRYTYTLTADTPAQTLAMSPSLANNMTHEIDTDVQSEDEADVQSENEAVFTGGLVDGGVYKAKGEYTDEDDDEGGDAA